VSVNAYGIQETVKSFSQINSGMLWEARNTNWLIVKLFSSIDTACSFFIIILLYYLEKRLYQTYVKTTLLTSSVCIQSVMEVKIITLKILLTMHHF